jgi:hypothetical protein
VVGVTAWWTLARTGDEDSLAAAIRVARTANGEVVRDTAERRIRDELRGLGIDEWFVTDPLAADAATRALPERRTRAAGEEARTVVHAPRGTVTTQRPDIEVTTGLPEGEDWRFDATFVRVADDAGPREEDRVTARFVRPATTGDPTAWSLPEGTTLRPGTWRATFALDAAHGLPDWPDAHVQFVVASPETLADLDARIPVTGDPTLDRQLRAAARLAAGFLDAAEHSLEEATSPRTTVARDATAFELLLRARIASERRQWRKVDELRADWTSLRSADPDSPR